MKQETAFEVASLFMADQSQRGDRFLPGTIEEAVSAAVNAVSHNAACDAMTAVFRRKLLIQEWGDPVV